MNSYLSWRNRLGRIPEQGMIVCAASLILALGLGVSTFVARDLSHKNSEQLNRELENQTRHAVEALSLNMRGFERGIRGTRGAILVGGQEHMTADNFRVYADSRDPLIEFPGSRGFGFIRRVSSEQLASYNAEMRRTEMQGRAYMPSERHAFVQFISPRTENEPLVGFDIATDPDQREAADAAMRSGVARMTPPLEPLPDSHWSSRWVLIVLPVYRPALAYASESERENATIGWAFAAIDLRGALAKMQTSNDVELVVRDVTEPNFPRMIEKLGTIHAPQSAGLTKPQLLSLHGRTWAITTRAGSSFAASLRPTSPRAALSIGVCVTILVSALVALFLLHLRRRTELRSYRALQVILDNSPGMVSYWNSDYTNRFANAAYARALKVSIDELRGRHLRDALGEEHYARSISHIEEARRGVAQSFERETPLAEGGVRHDKVDYVPDRPDGDSRGIFVFVNDITALKRAQQAMAENEKRLQHLYDTTPAMMYSIDAAGRILRVSGYWLKKLGYAEDEVLGRPLADFLTPASRSIHHEARRAAIANEHSEVHLEYQMVCKAGSIIDVELSGIVERDSEESFIRGYGVVVDVTARKAAEQRLRESEAFLDRAGRIAGVGAWSFDLRSQTLYWSSETCHIHGREPGYTPTLEEALRFYPTQSRALLDGAATECATSGTPYDFELPFIASDGTPKWVRTAGESERENGSVIRIFGTLQDITARKTSEEALRIANERLVMATDAAGIGIWEYDVRRNSVHCDAKMCRIYGVPPGTLNTFERWAVTLHPEDSDVTQQAVADALSGKRAYDTEFRVIRPDGDIGYVKAAGKVQSDSAGTPLLMVGITLDITERKRAQAAIEKSSSHARALYQVTSAIIEEHQLAALLQTVVEAVAEALPADRVTLITFDVNQHRVTHFAKGGPGSEFVVQVPFHELSEGLSGWVMRTGRPALSSKKAPDPREEPDVQRRRAETQCGDILVVPISYRGQILGTLTAINSLTGSEFEEQQVALMTTIAGHVAIAITNIDLFQELTDNARDLHAATERLTLAREAACMGIWEWDHGANTFRWDNQMYQIYGRARSGDIEPYAVWSNTLHDEDRQRAEKELRVAFTDDQYLDTEYRIVQPSGAVRHVKASARVQHDTAGTPLRLVGVAVDTTERNEAVARAQAANLAKSQFLANMSHEIRTPLNAIIGLGYLLEQTRLTEEQRSFLAKIQFAGRSLLSVVNNVLDLSKIEAGEMILEEAAFDAVGLAQQIGQMLAPQAQAKGVNLLIESSDDLPRLLSGDATRLRQILTNLLNNAIKFTERGHVALHFLCLEQTTVGVRLRCTVKDTGIGIAPEGIARLFAPFAQADASTTRRFGGTGLGLSIARRFVELMGGDIGVRSEVGAGSEFWVELPLRIAHQRDSDRIGQSTRPLHLLIIEPFDAPMPLDSIIRPLGWLSQSVGLPEEAVARLRVDSNGIWPDVIIIDSALPHFSPLQFVSRLRAEFAHVELPPFIVIDNDQQSYRQLEPLQQIVSIIVPRPVGGSALFNAVNSALAMRAGDHHSALQATNFDQVIAQWLAGAQILVVDDSEVNRVVAQNILAKQGANVAMCANGAEAVERLRADPDVFDVVLMDVQMPELDGNEATHIIRNELELKTLPIIALTAGALLSERDRSLAAGMNDFLSKPLEPATLIQVVRRFVELKRGAPLPVGIVDKERSLANVADKFTSIDATVVQQMFGNDSELFASLLGRVVREFAEFSLPIVLDIPDHAARKPWVAKLHKLRGSAGVIGAKAVQRLAGAGERALEEGQPADFIEAILRQLAVEFTALGEEVRPLVADVAANETAKACAATPAAPATEFMITELVDLLTNQNLDAIDYFKAVTPSLNITFGPVLFLQLKDAIEGLDFSQAASLLRAGLAAETLVAQGGRGA